MVFPRVAVSILEIAAQDQRCSSQDSLLQAGVHCSGNVRMPSRRKEYGESKGVRQNSTTSELTSIDSRM